jgi:hypothetical protein
MDFGTISLELVPWIRSGLRLVHFAGIILGVGAATLLDLIIFRFVMTRRIEETDIRIIVFASHVIMVGLALLWVSGLGFFVYYWFFDPSKIPNPKLVAKIIIVSVLTLNAFLVHSFVLPQITIQIGQYLLDGLSKFHCFLLIAIGTISAISWYVPLVLGIVPQFNNTIPAEVILASYAVLVLSVNVIIQIALMIIPYQPRRQ